MARSPRIPSRRLPESVRRRLEVATAMAIEALTDTHAAQATQFVDLLADRLSLEDSLTRYLVEMDLDESIAAAIRTRVLLNLETDSADGESVEDGGPVDAEPIAEETQEGWRRFRPDVVVRGIRERQRRDDETERWIQLSIARAEESVIGTHVENAITFAALLDGILALDVAVQHYLGAVVLTGGRAQAVLQRTMARLADVHLPPGGRSV